MQRYFAHWDFYRIFFELVQLTDLLRRDRPQVQWEVKLHVDIFQIIENAEYWMQKEQGA